MTVEVLVLSMGGAGASCRGERMAFLGARRVKKREAGQRSPSWI